MTSKLGQEAVSGRTVAVIITVLVILLVLGFFYYLDPNFIYKLLPDYNVQNQNGDQVIADADDLIDHCNGGVEVAYIASKSNYLFFNFPSPQKSALQYVATSHTTADLVVEYGWKEFYFTNTKIPWTTRTILLGKVDESKKQNVFIDLSFLDGNNNFYSTLLFSNSEEILTPDQVSYLSGSTLQGEKFFCKEDSEKLISENYIPAWPYSDKNVKVLDLTEELKNEGIFAFEQKLDLFLGLKGQTSSLNQEGDLNYLIVSSSPLGKQIGIIDREGFFYVTFDEVSLENFAFCRGEPDCSSPVFVQGLDDGFGVVKVTNHNYYKTNIHADYLALRALLTN